MSRCSDGRPGAGGGSSTSGRKGSPGDFINGGGAGHDGSSDPEMVGSSSVVVWAGCAALPRSTDTTLVGVNECTECDILDQFEMINGMPVYYGGDLYDSDWDDPYEIASAAWFRRMKRIELGVLPAMVTPIVDPVVGTSTTPALYPVPPIPVLSVVDLVGDRGLRANRMWVLYPGETYPGRECLLGKTVIPWTSIIMYIGQLYYDNSA